MKASFFKRLAAFLIDVMFITIVAGIATSGISNSKYEKAYDNYEDIMESYAEQEITTKEYLEQIGPVSYDMQKANMATSVTTLVLSIAYFMVFQYLNKGQTLGKKFLKLKVQENGKDPSLKAIIIRTFIIDSIFSTLFAIIFVYTLNRNNYYQTFSIISTIEMIFIFVSAIFILYRKDQRGLHDIIAHTEVIDERGK